MLANPRSVPQKKIIDTATQERDRAAGKPLFPKRRRCNVVKMLMDRRGACFSTGDGTIGGEINI